MMKKIFLFVLFWASMQGAFAQYSLGGGKIGLAVTNLKGDIKDNHAKAGLNVNFLLHHEFTQRLGLRMELGYVQMGAVMRPSLAHKSITKVNYYQLAPMLAVNVLPAQKFNRLCFLLGFSLDMVNNVEIEKEDVTPKFKQFNRSLMTGVSFVGELHDNLYWTADLQYKMGMGDILLKKDEKIKSSGVIVSFGLCMPLYPRQRLHWR